MRKLTLLLILLIVFLFPNGVHAQGDLQVSSLSVDMINQKFC
jgi:hypothetical protein